MDHIVTTFSFNHLVSPDELALTLEGEALGENVAQGLAEISGYLEAEGISSEAYGDLIGKVQRATSPSKRQRVLRQIAQKIRADGDQLAKILPKMRLQKLRFGSREEAVTTARQSLKPRRRNPQHAFVTAGDGGVLFQSSHHSSGAKPPAAILMAKPEPVQATYAWVKEQAERLDSTRGVVVSSRIRASFKEARVDRLKEEAYGSAEAREALLALACSDNEGAKAALKELTEFGFEDARAYLDLIEESQKETEGEGVDEMVSSDALRGQIKNSLADIDSAQASLKLEDVGELAMGMAVIRRGRNVMGRLRATQLANHFRYAEEIAAAGKPVVAKGFINLLMENPITPEQWNAILKMVREDSKFLFTFICNVAVFLRENAISEEWEEQLLKIDVSKMKRKALGGDDVALAGICCLADLIDHAGARATFAEIISGPDYALKNLRQDKDRLSGLQHLPVGGILDAAERSSPDPDAVIIVRWLRSIGHREFATIEELEQGLE